MGRYCENCGVPMLETEAYCHNCGTPRRRDKYCQNCGAPILGTEDFCQNCGAPMSTSPLSEAASRGFSPPPQKNSTTWLFGILGGVLLSIAVVVTLFVTGVIGGNTQQPGQTNQQGSQSMPVRTPAQGEGSGIPITDMTLEDLQGEWRGVGRLYKLENIDQYEWNWEVISSDEAALYNSMLNIDNTFYFTVDQDNDIGYQLLSEGVGWRGFADTLIEVTLIDGELHAEDEGSTQNFECQLNAKIRRETDGSLMIEGTVEAVIIQGGAYGVERVEIPYSISFSVKRTDE